MILGLNGRTPFLINIKKFFDQYFFISLFLNYYLNIMVNVGVYMGNDDGLVESFLSRGSNKVLNIDSNWYFSFAFGNEIALVDAEKSQYYILNCGSELWILVNQWVQETNAISVIKQRWYDLMQSKKYMRSFWTNDFEQLK